MFYVFVILLFCISSIKGAPIYDEFEEFSCGISDALTRYGNGSVVEDRVHNAQGVKLYIYEWFLDHGRSNLTPAILALVSCCNASKFFQK